MLVPLCWLRDYVDVGDSVAGLAEKLTFAGIEVEAVRTVGADLPGVVVGEVRAVERHPSADRLTVCRVFDGNAVLPVVCGAPNVRPGGRYPFAPVGTRLPGGTTIRKAKLRGVESLGMLCAEDELGLSDRHEGLLELDGTWAAGTPIAEVLGGPEVVLDLEITPNRPDCLSILGIAREVAALYGLPLRRPAVALREEGEPAAARTAVEVSAPELCPRYTARVLDRVRIGPSPAALRRRLELAGIRPISNVVDVTNYVLLECGHPLHAFDYDRLAGHRIGVRTAREGERMATLDGVERTLDPSMLLITDAERPVAVAGVMGGAGSEIGPGTTRVLLESAWFKPANIRHTSRKLGLSTESSYRFARGTDVEGLEWASRRAAALIAETAGAAVAPGLVDACARRPDPVVVACRWSAAESLLGFPVRRAEAMRFFRALELGVVAEDDGGCRVSIPAFRSDLRAEVDLIEELARLHGLDAVPAPVPAARIVPGATDALAHARFEARRRLVALGFREIANYSVTSEALLDRFDAAGRARRVRLPNPLSDEHAVLRDALLPQLAETLGRNRSRQVAEAALFEFGRAYRLDADGAPGEEERVAVGIMGPVGLGALARRAGASAQDALLWLKGALEAWFRALQLPAAGWTPADHPAFEPGGALAIALDGEPLGAAGILRRALAAEWRIHDPVAAAELRLAPLLARAGAKRATRPPPPYPSTERDVAFVVDASVRWSDIEAAVRRAAARELERVELFDIYRGGNVGAGQRSWALALTYRAADRTLTDEEANRCHDAVRAALRQELRAELREGGSPSAPAAGEAI